MNMKYIAAIPCAVLSVLCGITAATQSTDIGSFGWVFAAVIFTIITYFCAKDLG